MTDRLNLLRRWIPVLGWMAVISAASTDLMSAEHTSRFIGPVLQWFWPDISPGAIAAVQLIVRKTAHLTEYAVLAVLLRRASEVPAGAVRRGLSFSILAACLCYAALDEFHQSFVASRTGALADVMIDATGALFGLLAYELFLHNRRVRPRSAK